MLGQLPKPALSEVEGAVQTREAQRTSQKLKRPHSDEAVFNSTNISATSVLEDC